MNFKKLLFVSAVAATSTIGVKADEGMWLLPLLKQQNMEQLKKAGLSLDIDDVYNAQDVSLKDAVVIFGNGCTGEIISSEGLLLTNHHCGYGAIQQHSTVEHDYLADGFWAMNRSEELPTPDLTVQFIDKIEDVTDYVKEALAQDTTKSETDFLSPAYMRKLVEKKVGKEFTDPKAGIQVEIKPFYGGNKYYAFTKKVYADIRMVGAPPSSIGKFGADTDNWMWPRHTGDFSLFRVYADKEGNPAPYSPENTPLRPKKYFNISLKGVQENDYAMIMGFPGTTNRFYTSNEVKSRKDIGNATRIRVREIRQNVLLEEMLADPQVRIQYASKYARSSNYYKNSIGMNAAIEKLEVINRKKEEEKAFCEWAQNNGKKEYIEALNRINQATDQIDTIQQQALYLTESLLSSVEFSQVPTAVSALETALKENKKENIAKELETLEAQYKKFANKDYNAGVDKKVAKAIFAAYLKDVPAKYHPGIFQTIQKKYKGNTDKFIDDCFGNSIFASDANFEKFKNKPTLKALENDPMIQYATSVRQKRRELYDQIQPISTQLSQSIEVYIAGLLEMAKGTPIYPDANFTIRLSYGNVLPYDPTDGVTYHYFTTLDGVMQKEDPNNWEFVVPAKLKELWETKAYGEYAMENGSLPVNFLSNNDITGGNSGSPVINGNGELIGCAFDGNWEAMSGDIVFEPSVQRTINVDIRYVLFIIDKFAGAKHLVDEMTIIR
ncbi:MAG: S46 family peptidase [Bacteroidales bacterium]